MDGDLRRLLICPTNKNISKFDYAPPNFLIDVRSTGSRCELLPRIKKKKAYRATGIRNSRNVSLLPTSLSLRRTLIIDSTSVFFASFVFSG